MNRLDFLKRASAIVAGIAVGDRLELLDRIDWKRTLFPGFGSGPIVTPYTGGSIVVTKAQWDALLQEDYVMDGIVAAINKATPFKDQLQRPVRSLYEAPRPRYRSLVYRV